MGDLRNQEMLVKGTNSQLKDKFWESNLQHSDYG